MRKFYLQLENGVRLDLNSEDVFFSYPQGLGYESAADYTNIGGGFFLQAEAKERQSVITGDIVFASYGLYKDNAMYLDAAQIVYAPEDVEYLRDIVIQSVGKGELDATGLLICPVTILALSPWYTAQRRVLTMNPSAEIEKAKRYPYRYSYAYAYAGASGGISVSAGGQQPSPVKVTMQGRVVNPVISLYRSGVLIGKAAPSVTVPEGSTLIYDSRPKNPGIWIDGVSVIDALSLDYPNFFEIPTNAACTLRISASAFFSSLVTIDIFDFYKVV